MYNGYPAEPAAAAVEPTAKSEPFHLDPSKDKIGSIVHHFNSHEFQAGVAELRALQDADGHGYGDVWKRHIAVINGSINLQALGVADADQLLGVTQNGTLITSNKADNREQFRQGDNLSVKGEMPLIFGQAEQIASTKTYEDRLAQARAMEAHPEPKGDTAQKVQSIIADFNNGKLADGAEALRSLQLEDSNKEPEQWVRHIAAVNANIDLKKMGIDNASQILSVDDKGRLVTASSDLKTEQTRSLTDPQKIENEKDLATSSFLGITYDGDSTAYDQAKKVATLQSEAQAAREPLKPGQLNRLSLTSDGEQREFDVYVPKGYDSSKPARAFYVFHNALFGGDDVPHGEMENETNLNEKADKQGFIVVYPLAETHQNDSNRLLGTDFQYHSWNSPGAGMNVTYGNYDDVNYVKAATSLLDSKLNINDRYALGFSEGGEFVPHMVAQMPGYWSGAGVWHPTSEGTEAEPHNDALAYEQITGEKDKVLPRYGGTKGFFALGDLFGELYPRLATSEPTAAFDRMAEGQGCSGTPTVDRSNPAQVVTTFSAQQCTSGRPVVDIDRAQGEHAVDGDNGNWFTRLMGWEFGSKDRSWDSTQYFIDTLSQYHQHPAS